MVELGELTAQDYKLLCTHSPVTRSFLPFCRFLLQTNKQTNIYKTALGASHERTTP